MPYTSCTDTELGASTLPVIFLLNVQTRGFVQVLQWEDGIAHRYVCGQCSWWCNMLWGACAKSHQSPGAKRTKDHQYFRLYVIISSSSVSVLPTAHVCVYVHALYTIHTSFQQLMCVYMYMHCILFIYLLHVSCNFLVTVQENYKPLFSSYWGIPYSVSTASISGALKHIVLISLSICPFVLKTTQVVINVSQHIQQGVSLHTHTHTHNHGKHLFCFSRFLCFNCSML